MDTATKLINDIDKGWKHFWTKRGYMKPFEVSQTTLGEFVLPVKLTHTKRNNGLHSISH